MNIVGNGVDIVKNQRIEKALKNKKFLNRIYSKKEISASKKIKNKVNFFAKRFAAKEAFVKAIGLGFRNHINFKDIIVVNNVYGKPELIINNKLKVLLKKKFKYKNFKIFLSLSDEKNHSVAFVIIEKKHVQ
tara:strand:+ start:359 stop:754 length:396 start_codon:yes stop_codon:yes gene_type:complete